MEWSLLFPGSRAAPPALKKPAPTREQERQQEGAEAAAGMQGPLSPEKLSQLPAFTLRLHHLGQSLPFCFAAHSPTMHLLTPDPILPYLIESKALLNLMRTSILKGESG